MIPSHRLDHSSTVEANEGPRSNRPDVQSQHPGAGAVMAGGGGPPPPQGQPPGYGVGPPKGQGNMQYK